MTARARSAADLFVAKLASHGVDYIFANAGSDFPSIIEALASSAESGAPAPKAFAIPHENLAVSMAHGYTMVTGRAQAVMVHVNVGTANALCALFNGAREQIPMLVAAGRTPYTDEGHHGSRTIFSQWGQEMFDQAGIVREIMKWEYELRLPDQVGPIVDRALAIARSDPKGPVYVTLPREVLALPAKDDALRGSETPVRAPAPDQAAITEAAAILAAARNPLILTSNVGLNVAAVTALGDLAERHAIPVVNHVPRSVCLPTDHSMHLGYAPASFVPEADAILVVESDVPWIPVRCTPRPDARIIQLGVDPLYSRLPMRSFRCDLAIAADPAAALRLIAEAMQNASGEQAEADARRGRLAKLRAAQKEANNAFYDSVQHERPMHPAVISRAVNAVKHDTDIVINELGLLVEHMSFTRPGTYFSGSSAGGLGWGLGAALGAKLAAQDRLVIAAVGDGSYMFGNPVPAHFVAQAHDLPVLFLVMNNGGWKEVRAAAEGMYPGGALSRANRVPLAALEPSPAFDKVVEASGGYGEKVEEAEHLLPALERALHAVKVEKRQALLNIRCGIPSASHHGPVQRSR